jgi:hypothetical protein
MRNIDADLSAELAKTAFTYFHMVEFYFTSATYRYTDFQYDLYYGGNKFSPRGMSFGDMGSNTGLSVDKITVEMDDTDLVLSALLLGEDVRYTRCSFYVGAIDANHEIIAINEFFRGVVDSWELPEPTAKITVATELIKWQDSTLRIAQSTCPWVFNAEPYTNLITGWNNNVTYPYDTLTKSGADILAAVKGGPGWAQADSDVFSVTIGKLYKLVVTATLNSGEAPSLYYGINAAHSGWQGSGVVLTAGTNIFIWRSESTYASEFIIVGTTSATNYSATFALYEVTECAYIGSETWCDQSYDRCSALGNADNFGGMRFIPSIAEKEIWWGKIPS